MKKIIIAAVCAFCALTASAQRASSSSSSFFSTEKVDGGVQFGIRAGLNVAGMDYTEDCSFLYLVYYLESYSW